MADKKLPRGIRQNNPGNIRKSKDKWQGLASEQPDKEFFTFKDPTYGIRAMARILIKYQDDYDCNSVRKIIDRWAPPVENNTTAYINRVARDMGVDAKQTIDVQEFDTMYPLVEAIIEHENGSNPYTRAQITKGLVLAGVEPNKPKSLLKDKKVVASAGTTGLTLASMLAEGSEHAEKAQPIITMGEKLANLSPYLLGALVVILAGFIIYDRIMDRKKGLI